LFFHIIDVLLQAACNKWSYAQSYSTFSLVNTGMGDRLWMGIPPQYLTKSSRSTQPCILWGH